MTALKIGVLLPKSSLYPGLAIDLVNGLKAGLKAYGCNVQLVFENIGFGGDADEIYARTEKLLLQEEAPMVIAYMDSTAASRLDPLFAGMNRLLLVLDPGAHVPIEQSCSPHRFTISQQTALGSRLSGRLAVKEGGKKNVFATSFYEAGYLQCYTYQRGMEAEGGSTCFHFVVPFRLEQFQIAPLQQAFAQLRPDAVLAQFSAESGHLFLNEFAKAGLNKEAKLYASPFMLEEQWLSTLPFPFEGITGYTSWARALTNEANASFRRDILEQTKKEATVFSMAGWEAAVFTKHAIDIYTSQGENMSTVLKMLEAATIESPRGMLKLHAPSHYLYSPMYKAEIIRHEASGNCALQVQEQVSVEEDVFGHHIQDYPVGVLSKWTNTYLCI